MTNKLGSVEAAVAVVKDGDTIGIPGLAGIGTPGGRLAGMSTPLRDTLHPLHPTFIFTVGHGGGKDRRLGRRGRGSLPSGRGSRPFRDIVADKPGTQSRTVAKAFSGSRAEGGRINTATAEEIVNPLSIDGKGSRASAGRTWPDRTARVAHG